MTTSRHSLPDEFWCLRRGGVEAIRDRDSGRHLGPVHEGFVERFDVAHVDFFRRAERKNGRHGANQRSVDDLDAASDEEMFKLSDEELGFA